MQKKYAKLTLFFIVLTTVLSACALLDKTPPEITPKSPEVEYGTILSVADVADISDENEVTEAKFQDIDRQDGQTSEGGETVSFSKPGEYTVTIVARDQNDNTAEVECPISVIDSTQPQIIAVTGVESVGYGTPVSIVGVRADTGRNGTGRVPADSENLPSSSDDDGDAENEDGGEGVIKVEYEDVSNVELSISAVEEAGNTSNSDGYELGNDGSLTFTQMGTYVLTIDVTDEYGNKGSTQKTIAVEDRTKPLISGLEQIVLSEYDALPDFMDNVSATDEIDGDLTQAIAVDSSAVNAGVPGTYNVGYSVSDAAGNVYKTARVVQIQDTTPPVLTTSQNSVSLTVGDGKPNYKSLVSAQDAADGDLSSKVSIDDSGVDYSTPGTYDVTYSVTDGAGNTSTKTLRVTVKAKQTSSSGGGGGTVYITRTGSKYHANGCRYLSRSKIPISKSSAQAQGYTPCSVCHPG